MLYHEDRGVRTCILALARANARVARDIFGSCNVKAHVMSVAIKCYSDLVCFRFSCKIVIQCCCTAASCGRVVSNWGGRRSVRKEGWEGGAGTRFTVVQARREKIGERAPKRSLVEYHRHLSCSFLWYASSCRPFTSLLSIDQMKPSRADR